jgi:hypothetical protein
LIRPILISLALLLGSAVPAQASKDPCAWLIPHLKKYNLPVKEFIYVAKRESGCNPKAINARFNKKGEVIWTLNKNGSIDRGLLQINSVHKQTVRSLCKGGLDLLLELNCNLKVGSYLYQRYGLTPWRVVSSFSLHKTD